MAEVDAKPLDFRDLQYRFAAHLRDPGNIPPPPGLDDRRLAIYRDLFFNNIVSLLAGNFPVLRSLHEEDGWRAISRQWYREHPSHTPLFPELGREFVRWLENHGDHPTWFAELAHYEWMEVVAANDESEIDDIAHDPDGDLMLACPVVSPVAWPLVYRYPVHRIRADALPGAQEPETPTCLIIARNRKDQVGFLEANPLTLHLIERLKMEPARTGAETLRLLARETKTDPDVLLAAGADILARLWSRDILLGTRC
jgi:hypothetical protein